MSKRVKSDLSTIAMKEKAKLEAESVIANKEKMDRTNIVAPKELLKRNLKS